MKKSAALILAALMLLCSCKARPGIETEEESGLAEYAAEVSDVWCDYTQLVCKISESRLFLYGGDLSVSLYDIEQNSDGYDILYHTQKQGALTANADGTLTLTIRHGFTKNNMSLPLTLERYTPEITDDVDGEIKGYEGNFYGQPVVNTVTRLEKQADDQLIRIPENSTPARSHDFD